jgi:hypothetical protein
MGYREELTNPGQFDHCLPDKVFKVCPDPEYGAIVLTIGAGRGYLGFCCTFYFTQAGVSMGHGCFE